MLREQVKTYISSLTDPELIEYVMTGARLYEPEAVDYARKQLDKHRSPLSKPRKSVRTSSKSWLSRMRKSLSPWHGRSKPLQLFAKTAAASRQASSANTIKTSV